MIDRRAPTCWAVPPSQANFSLDRRRVISSLLALPWLSLGLVGQAQAEGDRSRPRGLSRYIKKKALGPLVQYVPPILLVRSQLPVITDMMATDVKAARDSMREGAFEGLRTNVKAVAQYAEEGGKVGKASDLEQPLFRALEEFDAVLRASAKGEKELDKQAAGEKLAEFQKQLEVVLATLPADVRVEAEGMLTSLYEDSAKASAEKEQEAKNEGEAEALLEPKALIKKPQLYLGV